VVSHLSLKVLPCSAEENAMSIILDSLKSLGTLESCSTELDLHLRRIISPIQKLVLLLSY